jgi:hypothetical protein
VVSASAPNNPIRRLLGFREGLKSGRRLRWPFVLVEGEVGVISSATGLKRC